MRYLVFVLFLLETLLTHLVALRSSLWSYFSLAAAPPAIAEIEAVIS